jgi:hypothetical protein
MPNRLPIPDQIAHLIEKRTEEERRARESQQSEQPTDDSTERRQGERRLPESR